MNIVGKKYFYFALSLLVLIPGMVSILLFGLNLSIDFTGGSEIQVQSAKFIHSTSSGQNSSQLVQQVIKEQKINPIVIQKVGDNTYFIKTKPISQKTYQTIINNLKQKFGDIKEVSFQSIGPSVGSETTVNGIKALVIASILIVLYIAWSFRKVPHPASSFRFGICAIVALIHDALVVVGIFSLLGHFFHVEVDSLFLTAILTVIGFSVHDTIVVFDRIRENLRRMSGSQFSVVVNESIIQTLGRSLNTSLTVILVLFTMFLFGGESIKWFIVALLVGVISGTYSSIFNAAPLLVLWEEFNRRKVKN